MSDSQQFKWRRAIPFKFNDIGFERESIVLAYMKDEDCVVMARAEIGSTGIFFRWIGYDAYMYGVTHYAVIPDPPVINKEKNKDART